MSSWISDGNVLPPVFGPVLPEFDKYLCDLLFYKFAIGILPPERTRIRY
jgi:hypothetical protein